MEKTFHLGTHSDILSVDSVGEVSRHLTSFARQAHRYLQLFSPTLSPQLYNNADFLSALSQSIRSNSRIRVQILVGNPGPSVKGGHRLVALAEKLSSFIEIRRTHKDFLSLSCDYMLADKRGYVLRKDYQRFETEICYNDPLTTDSYCKQFSEIWEASTREREFLRLHI